MNLVDKITAKQIRKDLPEFRVGDTVIVHAKIVEGTRHRIQLLEGIVIGKRNGGVSETFTVRKLSQGVGVERIWPLNSPSIDKIEVIRKGKVRRAKLNYLRDLVKQPKIKERQDRKDVKVIKETKKTEETEETKEVA